MRRDKIGFTEKGLAGEDEAKFVQDGMSKLRSEGRERRARQRLRGIEKMGDMCSSGTGEEWEMSLAGWTDREGPGKPGYNLRVLVVTGGP